MILFIKVTPDQKKALLNIYPDIKSFVEKTISDTADKIIMENDLFNVDEELEAYHDRRELNENNIHSRKCTQATKDKTSKTLKEKYKGKHYPLFEETKRLIGLKHKGKTVSQATRDKVSKALTGKKRTEEQRENIGKAHKGLKYKKRVKK